MQLTGPRIAGTLGALAGALLGAAPLAAQTAPEAAPQAAPQTAPQTGEAAPNAYDETSSEAGTLVADTAVLYYQEDESRVRVIESETGLTWNRANGTVISGKFVYDSLTGATPNGAARSRNVVQTFRPPTQRGGHLPAASTREHAGDTTTGASGIYEIKRGRLPVDAGFKDRRKAVDLGVTVPVASGLKLSMGGAGSWEMDFTSYSGRASLAKELFNKNTTLSLGYNYERDSVKPFTGIPRALASMGETVVGTGRHKVVSSFVAGLTQVLTPGWLAQLNWSHGVSTGYQTDPYKLVSLVDSASGDPFAYVYEKRPDRRVRDSIYAGTKFALGSAVTDASVRWYRDSWGIKSWTFALSEHAPLGRSAYVEPGIRYYRQTGARFFRHYLLIDEITPDFVSADSRLGAFHAWTFGIKAGAKIAPNLEIYGAAERYIQEGQRFDRTAPGTLARTDLFAGSKSVSLITGLRVTFR
ncbi:hypothetical protein AQZ52_11315 [Novosphingobium fuchskuhlense]|uniref:DUF3570 domain-containing protein n=1 Tax=Novosphingobium fuchskuhlense TaxID=1117702 RepID=A0A117UUT3_9SPHN|nr:DUF3570 domain-containing protein [Novosphingobium fuchskuhlense]KUR71247.1 hypothetical protein AQZ52_11315 [Novosphingobium fuchskuhlense]